MSGAATPGWAGSVVLATGDGGLGLVTIVAAIVAAGVLSQVLASRFRVPSVVFLIAAGIALGPEGAGLLGQAVFGDALRGIVGVSVAIIVFEGAFNIRVNDLRAAPRETLQLVTVGAVIALVGTALAVRVALGANWILSFLIGALLVATGPTVISPILEVVPVRDRVETALETEGIVNDVTAAIVAVVLFEVLITEQTEPTQIAALFVERLGIGVVVGAVVAGLLYYALRYVDLSTSDAPQNARLLVLAGAVVAFGVADAVAAEAGVAAAAAAGVLLGNLDIPYEDEIESFKGDVTLVVLSFVFITLASLLQFEDLLELGTAGLAVVAVVALVIRPLLVMVSTVGDRFTRREKLFMGAVGPRGIIPASVATLFAIELQAEVAENPLVAEGDPGLLVGTVFLVILATVVFQGGLARQIAELLDVIPMRVIVVGGGNVGQELAERLEDRGENVVLVERDEQRVEEARDAGFAVHFGDGRDVDQLRSAGAENAKIVVAATGDDDTNIAVAQLVSSKFEPETVIARANDPENVGVFEDLGVRTISSTLATATAIDNVIERPTLSKWMTELGRSGDVQEVTVTADEFVGLTVAELDERLPRSVLVALVGRNGDSSVPEEGFTLQRGDRLTFLGRKEAVREATDMCHPNNTSG